MHGVLNVLRDPVQQSLLLCLCRPWLLWEHPHAWVYRRAPLLAVFPLFL